MKTKLVLQRFVWNKLLLTLFCSALAFGLAQRAVCEVVANTIGNHRTIGLRFPEVLDFPSADVTNNYYVNGGDIIVTNIFLHPDGQSVELQLAAPVGEFFSVGISNVVDIFANVFNTIVTGYFSDYNSTTIGTPGDPNFPGHVFTARKDTFEVNASGSDIGGTNDHGHFIHQTVIGDFDMAVLVTRLDNNDPLAKAGLMVRENLSPGSPGIFTVFTPIQGASVIQTGFRQAPNTPSIPLGDPFLPADPLRWLRITRSSNIFTTFVGTDGVNWDVSSVVQLPLNQNLEVGMVVTSHNNAQPTTAGFTAFGVFGARPGDGVAPQLKVTLVGTNVVLRWQRTPRDFAVQVSNDLIPPEVRPGIEDDATNATQWAFLMIPIFDTSLTGTNEMSPTPGRYMAVPLNLYSNDMMFLRLVQVDRVIPDPIMVTPGIILSQALGNMKTTTSGATLCGTGVDTTTALAQVGVPILCPKGKTYEFTTTPSGSTLQTVLQVRNYPSIGTITCDGLFSAGSYKAQVTVTNSTQTGYTFVVAATTVAKPTSTCPLKVQINIK